MNLFDLDIDVELGLSLASRVHRKYRPVFERLPDRDRAALAFCFLPYRSPKEVLEVTRPRVVKWYCPFADQRTFPSGHRYCINVYTGCQHECQYCYASGYIASQPGCKRTFRADLINSNCKQMAVGGDSSRRLLNEAQSATGVASYSGILRHIAARERATLTV